MDFFLITSYIRACSKLQPTAREAYTCAITTSSQLAPLLYTNWCTGRHANTIKKYTLGHSHTVWQAANLATVSCAKTSLMLVFNMYWMSLVIQLGNLNFVLSPHTVSHHPLQSRERYATADSYMFCCVCSLETQPSPSKLGHFKASHPSYNYYVCIQVGSRALQLGAKLYMPG